MEKGDRFGAEDCKVLLGEGRWPCVSLHLPVHPPIEERQDRTRLKNLIRSAEKRLDDIGVARGDAEQLLAPAWERVRERSFWRKQSSGLAFFLSQGFSRIYEVPLRLPELSVVSERFNLHPLLPLLADDGHFYVLVISKNKIRFLEGSAHGLEEIDIPGMPVDLADSSLSSQEKSLNFHVGTPPRAGGREPMFHGHGGRSSQERDRVLRYFRQIDECLTDALRNDHAPLVLAGVAHHVPTYRAANSHPHLLPDAIRGNHDHASLDELHDKAWNLIEPVFARQRARAVERYRELGGSPLATDDLDVILGSSRAGRIDTLFAARLAGSPVPEQNLSRQEDALVESCVTETLLRDGIVYTLDEGEYPLVKRPLAAIHRY